MKKTLEIFQIIVMITFFMPLYADETPDNSPKEDLKGTDTVDLDSDSGKDEKKVEEAKKSEEDKKNEARKKEREKEKKKEKMKKKTKGKKGKCKV